MKVISLLILIIVFVSCGNKKAIDSDLVETTKDSTLKESDEADYLEQETDIIDQSLEQNIMIVQDKIYHEDEISGESEQREWVGLFKNADRYYLEEVRLNFERVKDELLDEKDQKTGWKISTENKDESIFFVSGLSNVIEGDVRFNQLDKNETLPEESCSFSFLNGYMCIISNVSLHKQSKY